MCRGILRTQYSTSSGGPESPPLGPWNARLRPLGSIMGMSTLRPREGRAWPSVLQRFCFSALGHVNPHHRTLDTGNTGPGIPKGVPASGL